MNRKVSNTGDNWTVKISDTVVFETNNMSDLEEYLDSQDSMDAYKNRKSILQTTIGVVKSLVFKLKSIFGAKNET